MMSQRNKNKSVWSEKLMFQYKSSYNDKTFYDNLQYHNATQLVTEIQTQKDQLH